MITFKEIMKIYQVSRTTVQKWVKAGLPSYKTGRLVRFDPAEVDRWIRRWDK